MKNTIDEKKSNKLIWYPIFSITLLFTLSVLYSCGANIFSVQDDVQLGKEIDQEIKSQPNQFKMLSGHEDVKSYINEIGSYILNNSKSIKYRNIFPYNFQIVNEDSTVNAFSTPGGYIYVYTGLIKYLDNEASLAGVIGHEIAHAENRHMTQRLTSYYGVSLLMNFVLGQNPSTAAEIAANLFTGLGFLANSREDEEEADNYSIKYLTGSKYYPGAISFFFDKILAELRQKNQVPGDLERLLSDHPLPQDRINNVNQKLRKMTPKPDPTQGLFAERYRDMKSRLP